MYLIQVTYTKPIGDIDKHLVDHRSFLDKFYASGNLICSGPRNPRIGGIILCNFASIDDVWSFIHQDPFYINEIASYEVIDFNPVKYAKDFAPFIK
ncbi:MAG: GTP cyclohydrolase [Bacteroidales bacterium]|nr:MAG: GTP cyclohydrolase [Bacteroidales bacterium]